MFLEIHSNVFARKVLPIKVFSISLPLKTNNKVKIGNKSEKTPQKMLKLEIL